MIKTCCMIGHALQPCQQELRGCQGATGLILGNVFLASQVGPHPLRFELRGRERQIASFRSSHGVGDLLVALTTGVFQRKAVARPCSGLFAELAIRAWMLLVRPTMARSMLAQFVSSSRRPSKSGSSGILA